jgi:hypothetical protein
VVPGGHRLTILGNLFVCEDCWSALDFERFASLAKMPLKDALEITDGRWEAYEQAYDALEGRKTFCSKCLAELEECIQSSPG